MTTYEVEGTKRQYFSRFITEVCFILSLFMKIVFRFIVFCQELYLESLLREPEKDAKTRELIT